MNTQTIENGLLNELLMRGVMAAAFAQYLSMETGNDEMFRRASWRLEFFAEIRPGALTVYDPECRHHDSASHRGTKKG